LEFHSARAEVKEWVELYIHSPNTPSWRGAQLGGAQGLLYYFYSHVITPNLIQHLYVNKLIEDVLHAEDNETYHSVVEFVYLFHTFVLPVQEDIKEGELFGVVCPYSLIMKPSSIFYPHEH
jgi:hypothetical protein